MSALQTIINIGVGVIVVAIFGFVIFKLLVMLNEQMNRYRDTINARNKAKNNNEKKEDASSTKNEQKEDEHGN